MNKHKLYLQLRDEINKHGGRTPCEDAPDAYFFDEIKERNLNYKTTIAKKLCGECPVQAKCAEYAIEADEEYGVWGGLTVTERRKIKYPNERFYYSHSWRTAG